MSVEQEARFFFSPSPPLQDQQWGQQSNTSDEYEGSSLEINRPGCEAQLSASTNTKVTNAWSYSSTSPYFFMNFAFFSLVVNG